MTRFLSALAAGALLAAPVIAGPKVAVVVGPSAPKLEKFAADELAALLNQLFEAEVTVSDAAPAAKPDHLILLGSPATNPPVAKATGDKWPKLSDQGHLLRSVDAGGSKALVVGGGSPVATLWAAYELGHHFGVRSFLHGDVMPEKVPPLKLDGIDIKLDTEVKVRALLVGGDSPLGFGVWGVADYKPLLRQLAKLKFNRVDWLAREKMPIDPFAGKPFPVTGDTPGRKAFKGAKEFDNPDLAGKTTPQERAAALGVIVRGLRHAAAEVGITTGDFEVDRVRGGSPPLAEMLPHIYTDAHRFGATPYSAVPPRLAGDLSPQAYSFGHDAFLAPKENNALDRFFSPILGLASTERVVIGCKASYEGHRLAAYDLGGFKPNMIAEHLKAGKAAPDNWKEAREKYTEAMNEMYRGIRATFNAPARDPLLYYAKRCEFAVSYIAAMEATRLAGVAKAKGDKDAVVEQLERATESMYNALNAYGDVARDPSDRGVIAVLAEYAYRPLKAELKAAEKAAKGDSRE